MRPLRIECFGKVPLAMRCAKGDVHVNLLDVAYVPDLWFYLSPLHTVRPKYNVALDPDGAHRLGGSLSSVRRDTWSCAKATINRAINDPIADFSPGLNGAYVY